MARILVVDDTPQNIRLIELYLRETEFEVESAAGGLEAIDRAMRGAYDLILLDVVMPGIDGFEVCRRLKNDPLTAFVPVIFLTGRMSAESDKLAAFKLGAVDYIPKPVDREELVARVRVMLRLEGARSRLDRENVGLRAELARAQRRAAETEASLAELQRLCGRGDAGALVVVALGPDRVVRSVEAWHAAAPSALSVGAALEQCGELGGALTRVLDAGVSEAAVTVTADGGAAVDLRVGVRPDAGGGAVLALQDVTGPAAIARHLTDRALAAPPSGESAAEGPAYRMTDFVGDSEAVAQVSSRVDSLRHKRSTVLIYGESGTGKELVARALHFDGKHRNAPFIPLHCGAIAPELIESELFGYEKGAFTGADSSSEGLFRAADGGTIFLDEIAETSLSVQVKLLRVLQRGEVRPVGANKPRIVDVRIIAATNRDLLELVQEGKFREDLYYRLEVVTLQLPALRDRLGDLSVVAAHFLEVCNRLHDRGDQPVRGFSQAALDCMHAYSWPGNVRELENVIEAAFALDVGDIVQLEDLPARMRGGAPGLRPKPVQRGGGETARGPRGAVVTPIRDLRDHRVAAERDAIEQALRHAEGDKLSAARQLGMARSTFYRRLKELGLS